MGFGSVDSGQIAGALAQRCKQTIALIDPALLEVEHRIEASE